MKEGSFLGNAFCLIFFSFKNLSNQCTYNIYSNRFCISCFVDNIWINGCFLDINNSPSGYSKINQYSCGPNDNFKNSSPFPKGFECRDYTYVDFSEEKL